MAQFRSDKLQSHCTKVIEKLKWEKHVATHRLEKDMPVIEAKI